MTTFIETPTKCCVGLPYDCMVLHNVAGNRDATFNSGNNNNLDNHRRFPAIPLLSAICVLLMCGGQKERDTDTSKLASAAVFTPWTHFRGNPSLDGVNSLAAVPDSLKIAWTFKAEKAVISSPVTDGALVFFGSYDHHLYALDIHTGKLAWKFKAEDEIEASPVIYKDVILIGDLGGNFYSVSKTSGEMIWQFKAKDKIAGSANVIESLVGEAIIDNPRSSSTSKLQTSEREIKDKFAGSAYAIEQLEGVTSGNSPRSSDRVIFGSYDNNLYCLDIKDGELIWQYESGSYINGTAATDGNKIIFGGCDAGLHVISAEDGSAIGKIDTRSYIAGSAILKNNFAYIGTYGRKLLGINLDSMAIAWTYENDGRKEPFIASPALADTFLIAPSRDKFIHCVSPKTGELVWKFAANGAIDASPVIVGNRVVVGCTAGTLYIIDLSTGKLVNSFDMGGPLGGTPLVTGNTIIVGDENGVVSALR